MLLSACVLVSAFSAFSDVPIIANACAITYVVTPPNVTLIGCNEILVEIGEMYEDLGAEASSGFFGVLATEKALTWDVDTSRLGTYYVVYNASDPCGNIARSVRVVHVAPPGAELPVLGAAGALALLSAIAATGRRKMRRG